MKKKIYCSIWVHICQYVQYYYVCIQDFFALDKDWDFISVNLHRHSNIQGMYNLIYFLNLWTNGNKKYILTNWRTLLIKSLLQQIQHGWWNTQYLSTSQVLLLIIWEIVSSQSLTRVFLKPVVSLWLKDDRVCWLLWLPFPSTDSLVLLVPVFLLTFDGTVRGVPTAMVHGFFLAVVALKW